MDKLHILITLDLEPGYHLLIVGTVNWKLLVLLSFQSSTCSRLGSVTTRMWSLTRLIISCAWPTAYSTRDDVAVAMDAQFVWGNLILIALRKWWFAALYLPCKRRLSHVKRMSNSRLPAKALETLVSGTRSWDDKARDNVKEDSQQRGSDRPTTTVCQRQEAMEEIRPSLVTILRVKTDGLVP